MTIDAAAAARRAGVTIERLGTPDEIARASRLFEQVWHTSVPPVPTNLMRAIDHAGGYAYGAYDAAGELAGASVAFLGGAPGDLYLYSHITGTLDRRAGVGRALKLHQGVWALERGLDRVEWTFDPLVARNAAFNVNALGAFPVRYLVDFYGPMADGINRGDESDRLLVSWRLTGPPPVAGGEVRTVAVPDDVERLRRDDPDAARAWRLRVREQLGGALAEGWSVVGFGAGGYVLSRGR